MREMKDSGIEWIGNIPRDWDIKPIKYSFYISSGSTPQSTIPEYWDGDIRWITPADFKTLDKFISEGKRRITSKGFLSCGTKMVNPGTIILSKCAPIGSVVIASEKLCTNQGCLCCIPVSHAISTVYFYYLMSIYDDIFNLYGSGTTFKEISADTFGRLAFPVPSYNEQVLISKYLDSICKEIDSITADIQKEIELLQEYRKSVITEAVTKGLDPNVEMKDSGVDWIGLIPKYWEVKAAKYCIQISNGSDPKTDGEIPVYGSGEKSFKTCGEFKNGPVVLIGRKGATLHIPHFISGKYWNVDTAFDVRVKTGNDLRWYYYNSIVFDYKFYISQTTLPSMTQTNYETMKIPVPPLKEQRTIAFHLDAKCSEIDSIIEAKQKQLDTLAEYRKSLIYEYVTGKKEVPAV